jgi:hypothetical protein
MLRVLIRSGALEAARSNVEIIDAANVYVDWLAYAVHLLGPAQIDTQAANNKASAACPRPSAHVLFPLQIRILNFGGFQRTNPNGGQKGGRTHS